MLMTHQCEPEAMQSFRNRLTDRERRADGLKDGLTEQTLNGFLFPPGLAEELALPIMANTQTAMPADSSKPVLVEL